MKKILKESASLIGVLLFYFVVYTAVSYGRASKPPVVATPVAVTPPAPAAQEVFDSLMKDVEGSACAKYVWPQRGRAPLGYIKGMAMGYGKAFCHQNLPSQQIAGAAALGSPKADALAYYNVQGSLRTTYTFLIGLGMRESSGQFCEGRDLSANNVGSDTAESGMFQFSYNSHTADPSLPTVISAYYGLNSGCLNVFMEGVKCSAASAKTYGTGAGLDFQKLAKQCPGFAVEYASVLIRKLRTHFGPINTKKVEIRPECDSLLAEVEQKTLSQPDVCGLYH